MEQKRAKRSPHGSGLPLPGYSSQGCQKKRVTLHPPTVGGGIDSWAQNSPFYPPDRATYPDPSRFASQSRTIAFANRHQKALFCLIPKEIAYFKNMCKSVPFFAGIKQKRAKRSPQRARIASSGILFPGMPKRRLLPVLERRERIFRPSAEVPDISTVLAGMDSRGIYMPSARISRTESCGSGSTARFSWETGPRIPGQLPG